MDALFWASGSRPLFTAIVELGRARTLFGMARIVFVWGRMVMCTWDGFRQGKESSVTIKKSFSRPVCPAKRRLPSRWASRSSVSSASSPSPPPTVFTQRQTLTYSTYHTETVI